MEFFRGLRASAIDTPGGAGTCFELVSTSLAPSWSAECIPWTIVGSIQVQPDTGVDKLCLINTTYPPPYPAGLGWIRSLPRTKAPLLFPMFWLQEAKEHVPRQHCVALAAEAAGAQAFDAALVVGHFAAVSERSPFGFILTRKHCAARSDGSKLPVPSQDRRH